MHTEMQTDSFRYDARSAGVGVAIIALLLVLTILALFSDQNNGTHDLVAGILSIIVLLLLLGIFYYSAKRHPVIIRVGPDGIDLPYAFKKPLAWHDIDRIKHTAAPTIFWKRHEWLNIYPVPGVMPEYRLKSPRKLELWNLRRAGVFLPLHGLKAPASDVTASIGRFHLITPS